MDLGIEGLRAAVGGASAGLGFETARALAADGVQVAICSRDAQRIEDAAKRIGPLATAIVCDVGNAEGARAFVAEAREALGGIDILIANVGGPIPGPADGVDLDALRGSLELSFLALVAMIQAALPDMRARKWGRILTFTSIGVRQPLPGMVHSNAARSALTGYLKTLAREVAGDGVTVNSLLPGGHATERMRSLVGDAMDKVGASIPAGVVGDPADFGNVAAFLCSQHARYITGAAIPVAGGADSGI